MVVQLCHVTHSSRMSYKVRSELLPRSTSDKQLKQHEASVEGLDVGELGIGLVEGNRSAGREKVLGV